MLPELADTPNRQQVQEIALRLMDAIDESRHSWHHALQPALERVLLVEARLHDLEKALPRDADVESRNHLANIYGWVHHPDWGINCVLDDEVNDGPGVRFAFCEEVVGLTRHGKQEYYSTGRYSLDCNGTVTHYDSHSAVILAADRFLHGPGLAVPEEIREEFRSRVRDYVPAVRVAL